jgi:ABC-type microcin C transport system duplicated ATPase subunit YejF
MRNDHPVSLHTIRRGDRRELATRSSRNAAGLRYAESGSCAQIINTPTDPYTKQLIPTSRPRGDIMITTHPTPPVLGYPASFTRNSGFEAPAVTESDCRG